MFQDMSMFKKMKDRITDEVNLATIKLQNIQLIDQLAASLSQQTVLANQAPNQILPGPSDLNFTTVPNSEYSTNLSTLDSSTNMDDDNSEKSPQHQLFNETSIKRLSNHKAFPNSSTKSEVTSSPTVEQACKSSTIHLDLPDPLNFSSDLDDNLDDCQDSKNGSPDAEIDLLTDQPVQSSYTYSPARLASHREKYRAIVHAARKIKLAYLADNERLKLENSELRSQFVAMKQETVATKHPSLDSTLNSRPDKQGSDNHVSANKNNSKMKDLEKLLVKCKESLKQKNAQLQTLKDSLLEVENFKDYIQQIKRELAQIKAEHESWTVSIAENKQVMHQEIENKNAELEQQRLEINDLQLRLNDGQSRTKQLKNSIQDLESRLVSTSAAHQKERENLVKEMNLTKNNALKQLKREHEHNIERVKLDLEKSIEALKQELLAKDEQLMGYVKLQEELLGKNQSLTNDVDSLGQEVKSKGERVLELLQELEAEKAEHEKLKECFKLDQEEKQDDIKENTEELSLTELEYLKNIVYQFMIGKEPLVLARVISAIFKFDKDQIDHICRVQEAVQAALGGTGRQL